MIMSEPILSFRTRINVGYVIGMMACFLWSLLFSCRSDESITKRCILSNILVQDHAVKITLGNLCVGDSKSRLTGNHTFVVLWLQYRFCRMLLINPTKIIYFERGWLCSIPTRFCTSIYPTIQFYWLMLLWNN